MTPAAAGSGAEDVAPTPSGTTSGPSASGARIGGDDVQHLIAWYFWLKACSPGAGIASVTVEAAKSGTVDDVVVIFDDGRRRWIQVKASVTVGSGALDAGWLTAPPKGKPLVGGTKTLLRQLHSSWAELGRPRDGVELVTTRCPVPDDPLMACLDHTDRAGARLRRAADGSKLGTVRFDLADHVGCSVEEICDFFDSVRISGGQTEANWRDRVDDAAAVAGVEQGIRSQAVGVDAVRDWVKTTRDPRGRDELVARLRELGIQQRTPRAQVVIEAIAPVVGAEDAAIRLDWLDRFRGDRPETRRGLIDPTGWVGELADDLRRMRVSLEEQGLRRVAIGGAMRLPTWFAAGAELREVAGFDVAADCRERLWEPPIGPVAASTVQVRTDEVLGEGQEVAVVVEISAEGVDAVRDAFDSAPSVGRVLAISVAGGPNRRLLDDGAAAMSAAAAVRDWVRRELRGAPRVHLVLVGPAVFALFLGHLWDRVPPTTVYEDLAQDGYEAAFRFSN